MIALDVTGEGRDTATNLYAAAVIAYLRIERSEGAERALFVRVSQRLFRRAEILSKAAAAVWGAA